MSLCPVKGAQGGAQCLIDKVTKVTKVKISQATYHKDRGSMGWFSLPRSTSNIAHFASLWNDDAEQVEH
jgi:hypothetical protein